MAGETYAWALDGDTYDWGAIRDEIMQFDPETWSNGRAARAVEIGDFNGRDADFANLKDEAGRHGMDAELDAAGFAWVVKYE